MYPFLIFIFLISSLINASDEALFTPPSVPLKAGSQILLPTSIPKNINFDKGHNLLFKNSALNNMICFINTTQNFKAPFICGSEILISYDVYYDENASGVFKVADKSSHAGIFALMLNPGDQTFTIQKFKATGFNYANLNTQSYSHNFDFLATINKDTCLTLHTQKINRTHKSILQIHKVDKNQFSIIENIQLPFQLQKFIPYQVDFDVEGPAKWIAGIGLDWRGYLHDITYYNGEHLLKYSLINYIFVHTIDNEWFEKRIDDLQLWKGTEDNKDILKIIMKTLDNQVIIARRSYFGKKFEFFTPNVNKTITASDRVAFIKEDETHSDVKPAIISIENGKIVTNIINRTKNGTHDLPVAWYSRSPKKALFDIFIRFCIQNKNILITISLFLVVFLSIYKIFKS
jgi:hypothetical protein